MLRRPTTLTARYVEEVTDPSRYGDGRGGFGLSLLVKATSVPGRLSKTWSQRLTLGGREAMIGLGAYPGVTLTEARKRAAANWRERELGRDPRKGHGVPTFAEATEATVALRAPGWKDPEGNTARWRSTLTRYAGAFGAKPVDEVTPRDVVNALAPHWHTKPQTAKTVAERIGVVMVWSMGMGYRTDSPVPAALAALGPQRANGHNHHATVGHAGLPAALGRMGAGGGAEAFRLALELIALTATRTTEVTGMIWEEVDLSTATWSIPAARYKTSRQLRVPLSTGAVELLEKARALSGATTGPVFRSPRDGKPLYGEAFRRLVKASGMGTVHGLRSAFRDWCSETGVSGEIAEQSLGHAVKGIEGAYRRTDLLEQRRAVLQAWSDHLR